MRRVADGVDSLLARLPRIINDRWFPFGITPVDDRKPINPVRREEVEPLVEQALVEEACFLEQKRLGFFTGKRHDTTLILRLGTSTSATLGRAHAEAPRRRTWRRADPPDERSPGQLNG